MQSRCCYFGMKLITLETAEKAECLKTQILSEKILKFHLISILILTNLNSTFLDNPTIFNKPSYLVHSDRGGGDPDNIWCKSGGRFIDPTLWKGSTPPPAADPCKKYVTIANVTSTGFELMQDWETSASAYVWGICEYP
jgi:hypothetical protein